MPGAWSKLGAALTKDLSSGLHAALRQDELTFLYRNSKFFNDIPPCVHTRVAGHLIDGNLAS
eukprot:1153475-Pelagomonas_calceolata.AAC.4